MIPQTAVVCAAHTDLGKHVVRNLLRSPHVAHIYALSELEIRDALSHDLANATQKLTLIVHSLDYLERSIASSVPKADLAFYCLCSPRHAVPSLGAYLFHKLNYDIPLRFLHEMTRLSAHSVALFSHPSATVNSRSQFLRVKAELVQAANDLQEASFPHVPRFAFFLVPTLISHSKRPHIHHATDHAYNGVLPPPLSALDRFKQKAVLKHDPDAVRPLLARDVAVAVVEDALDSVMTVCRDNPASLRLRSQLFVTLDPPRIADLARTARAVRSTRKTAQRDRDAMRKKVSTFAQLSLDDVPPSSHVSSTSSPRRVDRPSFSSPSEQRNQAPPHSAQALGEQLTRTLTAVRDNDVLPDAAPVASRSRSYHAYTQPRRAEQSDFTSVPFDAQHMGRDPRQATAYADATTPPLESPNMLSSPSPSSPSSPPRPPERPHQRQSAHRRLPLSRSFHTGENSSLPRARSRSRSRSARRSRAFDRDLDQDPTHEYSDDDVSFDDDGRFLRHGTSISTYSTRARQRRPGLLATIAGKVLAVTERPSGRKGRDTRGVRRTTRDLPSLHADSYMAERDEGDMRAAGQTTI